MRGRKERNDAITLKSYKHTHKCNMVTKFFPMNSVWVVAIKLSYVTYFLSV